MKHARNVGENMEESRFLITSKTVDDYIAKWYANPVNKYSEMIIFELVKRFRSNATYENVQLKAGIINNLYSTRVQELDGVVKDFLAEYKNIDMLIANGEPDAVKKIAKCGVHRNFSFATKFCYFHNPNAFPIYDSMVLLALKEIKKKNPKISFKVSSFTYDRYESFRNTIDSVINLLDIKKTYGEIDKYLWQLGKEISIEKEESKRGQ